MNKNYSIVMLGSGAGSTIRFFCEKVQSKELEAKIQAVVTNNSQSQILSIAKEFSIPSHLISFKKEKLADQELCDTLSSYQPDLILLAGFLKKIGPQVLRKFKNKILNIHPALIPEFSGPGMYGSQIHKSVIQQKKQETGITIHLVNENYDEGQILHQEKVQIKEGENASELEERIKKLEKRIYLKIVLQIISGERLL